VNGDRIIVPRAILTDLRYNLYPQNFPIDPTMKNIESNNSEEYLIT